MILDKGICTIFRKTDASLPGYKPSAQYTPIWQSWYGEMNFETAPSWQTDGRKELKADGRIRILQNRAIAQNDVVVLEELSSFASRTAGAPVYQIIRAYHGTDDEGPTQISDLTLEVYTP